jgi:peptide/nickel transport system permease protein
MITKLVAKTEAGSNMPIRNRTGQSGFLGRFVANPSAWLGGFLMLLMVATALLAPLIAPFPYDKINPKESLQPPSGQHLFGTDKLGRDMFSRIIFGAQLALQTGLFALVIALAGGLLIGLAGGYFRGWLDGVLMGLVDLMLSFPPVLLALLIMYVLGPGFGSLILAVGLSPVPGFARLVRGQVLSIRAKDYVMAAQAIGASPARIMLRTILPNVLTPVIVLGTVLFPEAILAGAGLSFIGLGAQPPSPDWGVLLLEGRTYLVDAPWLVNFPGLAILLVVLGSNLSGAALRQALSQKS